MTHSRPCRDSPTDCPQQFLPSRLATAQGQARAGLSLCPAWESPQRGPAAGSLARVAWPLPTVGIWTQPWPLHLPRPLCPSGSLASLNSASGAEAHGLSDCVSSEGMENH